MPAKMDDLRTSHLVETDWLHTHLGDPRLRIIDMRGRVQTSTNPDGYQTAEYSGARDEYAVGHIPGAVYLDWTVDIVDTDDPVPVQVAPPEKVARILGAAGIGSDTRVVAYDDHPASQFATRLWWVLRYYGHEAARVLNGGWLRWIAEGRPTTREVCSPPPPVFLPRARPQLRATADQVRDMLGGDAQIVDARDERQFSGAVRRGPRGGRIPGALHLPRERLLGADGRFLPTERLKEAVQRAGIRPGRSVVAYCNGGVAATTVLFALSMLGHAQIANYDGSWNEWGARPDLPIECSISL